MEVNVDAALSKNSNKAAMAAVARDDVGNFLGASALLSRSSPEVAEAMAYREGLALATDLSLQKIRIATDCANVVMNIHGPGMGLYGHIIRENFQVVNFIHENRKSNEDAHRLARSSVYDMPGRFVWFLSTPDGGCTSYNL